MEFEEMTEEKLVEQLEKMAIDQEFTKEEAIKAMELLERMDVDVSTSVYYNIEYYYVNVDEILYVLEANKDTQNLFLAYKGPKNELDFANDILSAWDLNDHDINELMVSYGFSPKFEPLPDNAENVRIWKKPYYYNNTLNAPTEGYLREEDGDCVVFDTVQDAKDWIKQENRGIYYLQHGEYERPDFIIVADPELTVIPEQPKQTQTAQFKP